MRSSRSVTNSQFKPSGNSGIRLAWVGFAFLYLGICIIAILTQSAPVGDERVHYAQIDFFDHGVFRVGRDYFAMLPGYHLTMAALLYGTGLRSLAAVRIFNAVFGLAAIAAFHLLRKRVWPEGAGAATLQFALLPILFPFDFLVYTDVLALALVLGAAAATVGKRHVLSGLLMLAAMGLRQSSAIWLPLFVGIAVWPAVGKPWPPWREMLARTWPYALDAAAFCAYWAWNGTIALSAEQARLHPGWPPQVGNVFFALLLCALFFPVHVYLGVGEFVARARVRPWLFVLPMAAFAIYWFALRVDHPFNQLSSVLILHNFLAQHCAASAVWKAGVGTLAVVAGCGLGATRLRPPGAALLYPLSLIALAAAWMIEPRYALVPLALWLAFREARDAATERATTALWAVFAVILSLGMLLRFFDL
jgi:alpha-1,2-glucosyltransferase